MRSGPHPEVEAAPCRAAGVGAAVPDHPDPPDRSAERGRGRPAGFDAARGGPVASRLVEHRTAVWNSDPEPYARTETADEFLERLAARSNRTPDQKTGPEPHSVMAPPLLRPEQGNKPGPVTPCIHAVAKSGGTAGWPITSSS